MKVKTTAFTAANTFSRPHFSFASLFSNAYGSRPAATRRNAAQSQPARGTTPCRTASLQNTCTGGEPMRAGSSGLRLRWHTGLPQAAAWLALPRRCGRQHCPNRHCGAPSARSPGSGAPRPPQWRLDRTAPRTRRAACSRRPAHAVAVGKPLVPAARGWENRGRKEVRRTTRASVGSRQRQRISGSGSSGGQQQRKQQLQRMRTGAPATAPWSTRPAPPWGLLRLRCRCRWRRCGPARRPAPGPPGPPQGQSLAARPLVPPLSAAC